MYSKRTSFKKKHLSANYVSWAVWSDLESPCNDNELNQKKGKKLNFFVDSILIDINCALKLPLNKITCFDDIIIRFDPVDKVDYRGKTCYFVNAYISKGKIMCLLNKIYNCYLLSLVSLICQNIFVVNNSNSTS